MKTVTTLLGIVIITLAFHACEQQEILQTDPVQVFKNQFEQDFTSSIVFSEESVNPLWENFNIVHFDDASWHEFEIESADNTVSDIYNGNCFLGLLATKTDDNVQLRLFKAMPFEEDEGAWHGHEHLSAFHGAIYYYDLEGTLVSSLAYDHGTLYGKNGKRIEGVLVNEQAKAPDCNPVMIYTDHYIDWYTIVITPYGSFTTFDYTEYTGRTANPYYPPANCGLTTEYIPNVAAEHRAQYRTVTTTFDNLQNLLEQDPNALIDLPCEELAKYQGLATHQVPDSVVQKLENLSNQDQTFLEKLSGFQSFRIQDLNDAHGTVVNMDYFPVTINQLPNGHTAESLLEHIRKNINDFINDDAYFQPYPDLPDEATLWNSSNPLGAILTIDLIPHDGSVIVTESSGNKWIFAVVRTPFDRLHPVTGNREFGFIQKLDGSYTFYTRGVDRLTQPYTSAIRDIGILVKDEDLMDLADNLWMSFQDKIKEFVDQNGGSSSLPSERNQGGRPDWNKVEDFLNGKISLNELRNDC